MKRMVETKAVELIESMAAKNVTPEMILAPKMEDIVDADGHKRFQEWEGTHVIQEGVDITFCKASLSGSHIMFVSAGTIANETTLQGYTVLGEFTLPEWIWNKISPVWSGSAIEVKEVSLRADDYSLQTVNVLFQKLPGNKVGIQRTVSADFTLTATRGFRIQFDLLID